LSPSERQEAPRLYRVLHTVRERLIVGEHDVAHIEAAARRELTEAGWVVDYVSVRRQRDLKPPTTEEVEADEPLVVLAAAKLGATRLIDNLEI
jgi:pantoate--beta-alanine ligase